MAEQNQDQDRTEDATPFKLREAKKRGQVAKSMETNSLLMLGMGLMVMYLMGNTLLSGELAISQYLFSQAHSIKFDSASTTLLFSELTWGLLSIFWPLIIGVIIVSIISNMTQTGPIFSFYPLKPDIQRLNPVAGFKRLFSIKLLYESVKSVIKLCLFATVIYFFIMGVLPELLALLDINAEYYPVFLIEESAGLMGRLLLVLLLIAILDFSYTHWDFRKKMRMSRRDVKDEIKRREGDPHIRSRQRELQKEASKRSSSIKRVPEADVLITNPTHLSVALLYKRGKMASPEVIAKGAGDLALKMREMAKKHHIPIVENKPLARLLFKEVELDRAIPEKSFPAVAKILVWAFAMRDRRYGRHHKIEQGVRI